MDLNEYQKETRSTVKYDEDKAFQYLSNAINGEEGELSGKVGGFEGDPSLEEIIHEIGDVLWGTARICDEFGFKAGDIYNPEDYEHEPTTTSHLCLLLSYRCSWFAELGKKNIRDDKNINVEKEKLLDLLEAIDMLSREFGYTINEVAEMNINKLKDRDDRGVIKGDGDKR